MDEKQGASAQTPATEAKGPNVEEFGELVANIGRFLTALSSTPAFKEASLGLGEWSALGALAAQGAQPINNKQLAKKLGVTVQRAAQISDALKSAQLATVAQSAKDGRKNEISVTAAGRAVLAGLNAKLEPMLAEGLKGRGAMVGRLTKGIRALSRAIPVEEKAPKAAKPATGSKAVAPK